jgi:hypothetical protein
MMRSLVARAAALALVAVATRALASAAPASVARLGAELAASTPLAVDWMPLS